ncbi:MAG: alpha-2-macroglobulin family protein, partial [Gammaproteobacteria bacterium]|nr:alpha-2-macroglobulin family protein [Gammaproteobacteria bacterium]
PGNFVLEMRAADGTVLNQVAFSVAGAANLSRSLERNAELTLSLSKPRHKPGETIEVSVRAPYAGSGLITIERDRVYAQAWFRADTTSSVQKIRVPADFEGNGYVNVQFLRDPSSDEIFMSPLTFGVAPFAVDRTARTQPLSIKLPAVVRPGALIPVDIKTEGKARVVVFAVDEGILQVARYRVGDPLDFFFTKKMLQVDTAQILDLLLPEFSRLAAMAAPGGDGGGDLAKNLNPFKRKSEKPAVWWSGIIDVDGSKKVNFRLPDHFNGRIRVTAVAVTADRLGIAETQATVRGDFVLTPTVPTHVAPGDEFELPVGIANTIEGARTPSLVNATLELPPSLTLVGAAPPPLSIAPGSEGTVRFRVRAGSALGAVAVVIRAKSGAYSAQRRIEVSLRPGIVARQDLRAGRAEQRVILEKLRVMYNPLSTRQLAASSSPLVAIDGLTAYLRDYPHLCTEQLLSQAMPALVYSSRPELGHKVDRSTGDRGNLVDVLRSRQNSEGGLGTWTATPDADPFVTAYAALYLLESRERGIAVPEDMLVSLNGYLETLAADASRNDLPFLRQRAMAVYLLVRQGRTASNLLSAVQEQLKRDQPKAWQDDAAGMLVAASYQLLQQDKAARPLAVKGLGRVNTASPTTAEPDYYYYYDGGIEQAWTLYLLNRHFPALARQVKPVALDKLMAPLRENSYNTLSSALTVLALDAQAGALGNPPPPTLQAAGKEGPGRQIGKLRGVVTFGNFTAADTRLWVTPASAEPVWYVLNQSGYDRQAPATTQSHGLEVIRDYLDNQGKPITTLALGQEVTVRLRVRALGAKARGQIAIVDLLPGGFEAVLQSPPVAAEPSAGSADEEDYVEDNEGDDEGEQQAYAPSVLPLALPGSNYVPDHIELREDRVVFYGSALEAVAEFKYKLRANNAGLFVVPPIYAESMYQRSVYAQGGPAGSLRVNAPSP